MSARFLPARRRACLIALLSIALTATSATAAALQGRCADGEVCETWSDQWDSGQSGDWWERATVVEQSPDGRTVVVTGAGYRESQENSDIVTIAYNARTGKRSWVKRFSGPEDEDDWPGDVVFSPDSRHVYVAGFHNPSSTNNRWRILAYDVGSGKLRWTSRGTRRKGYPKSAAISSSGKTLYVTGTSHESKERRQDIVTVAFRTRDGGVRWRTAYNGEHSRRDIGQVIALDALNDRLYVTGESEGNDAIRDKDAVTLRYDLHGKRGPELIWDRVTHSNPRWFNYGDAEMEVAPEGDSVYLVKAHAQRSATSVIDMTTYDWRYETHALEADDGTTLWQVIEEATTTPWPSTPQLTVDPGGDFVWVSGLPKDGEGFDSVVTKSYQAGSGMESWAVEHRGQAGTYSVELDAGTPAHGLFLFCVDMKTTGRDFRTINYDIDTGEVRWTAAYNPREVNGDEANASDGYVGANGWAYVTGSAYDGSGDEDFATVAYEPRG